MMKRYFVVKEFFGARIYDSQSHVERFFTTPEVNKVVDLIQDDCNFVDNSRNDNRLSAPLKISMNITKKCNLRCKQCFSDSGDLLSNELSTREVYDLFDDMHKYGTFFICIGGGEPLMRKDILEVLEYGHKKQLAVSIVSNGILFTKDLIETLNQYCLDTIWISLEGLEYNHERLRGKGTYTKALQAINLLKKYSNAKIAIRVSLSKYNLDEYSQIIDLAEKMGVDILRFTPLLEYGRAKGQNLTISQNQYIEFLQQIVNVKSSVKIIHPNMIDAGKFWVTPDDFGCHCGKEAIWIDEIGNYSPCFFFGDEYISGNIREEKYISLWQKSLEQTTFIGNETCKSCKNYKVCRGGCRARALAIYGDINAIDPLCPLKNNVNR